MKTMLAMLLKNMSKDVYTIIYSVLLPIGLLIGLFVFFEDPADRERLLAGVQSGKARRTGKHADEPAVLSDDLHKRIVLQYAGRAGLGANGRQSASIQPVCRRRARRYERQLRCAPAIAAYDRYFCGRSPFFLPSLLFAGSRHTTKFGNYCEHLGRKLSIHVI